MNRERYLYHSTWYRALRGIAEQGLVASGSRGLAISRGPYADYSRGRLFATSAAGVLFWYGRLELHAEHRSDRPLEDGLTPVILRFPDVRRKQPDEIGTRDAGGAPAYILTRVRIPPAFIDVWDGRRWLPVRRWRRVDPRQAYTLENVDGLKLAWFKTELSNPLIPSVWRSA